MSTYFEHVAGTREPVQYDTVEGDPTDEVPILRIELCEHGHPKADCSDCKWFAAWEAMGQEDRP